MGWLKKKPHVSKKSFTIQLFGNNKSAKFRCNLKTLISYVTKHAKSKVKKYNL